MTPTTTHPEKRTYLRELDRLRHEAWVEWWTHGASADREYLILAEIRRVVGPRRPLRLGPA